jgi:oxygen-independent coproporphyrinogen-3 oxidase
MHWGGGTPTYLSPEQITDIARYIRQKFTFSPEAEISVELDPRELTIEHLQALRSAGFNRVSMGVQDFNEQVQAAINRNQSEAVTRQAISWSRELGFASLNMDLIYGLPLQTVESFSATLDKVIEVSPDRIAVYNFAYVPWMKPHQKLIHQEDLPSPETKLGILTLTIRKLVEAGYVYIGMDHFAKANDEMAIAQRNGTLQRNFEGYSTKAGCDLFGLGMSAISHFGGSYAQNAKTLPEYYDAMRADRFATEVGYTMSLDDQLRKHVIMRLMCDLRLETNEVERKFHIQFDEYFAASLEKLEPLLADGLIRRDGGSYTVTMQGRLFLRNIAMCFDAYFPAIQKEKPIFSRTV